MNIKSDDTVVVLSGRDKGKRGRVLRVDRKGGKVVVEGVSVASRHQKPRKQGEEGGIIRKETPIYACKVMRVCPKCDAPTRSAFKLKDDGSKARVCKKCDAEI
ncbi:MAG: 50S ribosomal protein L24 [Oscillospiraceae bacterium]|jgi:large subunit ribosomal protein L24|nr:50S ribosomal protein L24 [Oscillospiraceae bacterium]